MHIKEMIPKGVEKMVIAICADYQRRAKVIKEGGASYRVLMEYKFLNYRVLDATAEIVGLPNAQSFIHDIGAQIGYGRTSLYHMSEVTYKSRKEEVKINIARRLAYL